MPQPNARNIRARRESLGIKRPALAQLIGVSYKHVHGIEAGRHLASIELLHRIATHLGVDIEEVASDTSDSDETGESAKSHQASAVPTEAEVA